MTIPKPILNRFRNGGISIIESIFWSANISNHTSRKIRTAAIQRYILAWVIQGMVQDWCIHHHCQMEKSGNVWDSEDTLEGKPSTSTAVINYSSVLCHRTDYLWASWRGWLTNVLKVVVVICWGRYQQFTQNG